MVDCNSMEINYVDCDSGFGSLMALSQPAGTLLGLQ